MKHNWGSKEKPNCDTPANIGGKRQDSEKFQRPLTNFEAYSAKQTGCPTKNKKSKVKKKLKAPKHNLDEYKGQNDALKRIFERNYAAGDSGSKGGSAAERASAALAAIPMSAAATKQQLKSKAKLEAAAAAARSNSGQDSLEVNNNNNNNSSSSSGGGGTLRHKSLRRSRDNYQLLRSVGKGSFGVVYKALELSSKQEVAIKAIDLGSSENDIQDMMTELTALCTLRSPYIIEYHTSFSEGFQLWIVMEYMNYGSISDLIKSDNQGLAEKYCRYIAHKICLALEYLNDNNVLHRDIKSANVLIAKDGSIKLADFGVAGSLSRTVQKRKTLVGTPFWMAPEVIQQDNYDQKADIWALGITCYEMINRHPPHYTQSAIRAIFAIVNSDPPEISENFSTQFRHFVACCLNKNPDKRLSIDELLKHPWFAKKMRKNVITELIVSIEKKKMKKKKGSATRDSVDFSDDDQKNNQIIKSNEIDSHISKEDTVIFPMDFNINKERENNSDKQSKITTQIIHTDQAKDPNNQDKESDNRIINNVPDPVKQINRQYLTNSNDAKFHLDTKSRMHSYYDKPNNAHKKVQQPIKQPTRERINSSLDTGTVRDKKLRYTIDEQYKITPKTNNSNDDQPSSSPINIASRINNLRVSQLTNLNNSQPPSGSPYVSRVSHYYNRARGEIHPSSATKSAADSHQIHLKQLKKVIKRYQLYTQVHNSEKDDPTNVLNELVTTSSNETLDTFESILKDIREEFE